MQVCRQPIHPKQCKAEQLGLHAAQQPPRTRSTVGMMRGGAGPAWARPTPRAARAVHPTGRTPPPGWWRRFAVKAEKKKMLGKYMQSDMARRVRHEVDMCMHLGRCGA